MRTSPSRRIRSPPPVREASYDALHITARSTLLRLCGAPHKRKNWLFAGSAFGGERAAVWFSLIGSARLHEVEPWAYLRDVLTRLPELGEEPGDDALRELLPDRWLTTHPDARLPLGR